MTKRFLIVLLVAMLALVLALPSVGASEPSTTLSNGIVEFERPNDGTGDFYLRNVSGGELTGVQVFDLRDGEFKQQNKFSGTLAPGQEKYARHNIKKGSVVKITWDGGEVEFDFGRGNLVVRVFMDANNDVHDRGESGLQGWEVKLRPGNITATTGPNGYASFRDLDITRRYVVSITNPNGGPPVPNGWRLARGNADTNTSNLKKVFVVGPRFVLEPNSEFWQPRNNGSIQSWVRFSAIRVNRITTGGANAGDVIEFYRVRNGRERLMDELTAGPNGFASVVGGGYFYEEQYRVVNTTQDEEFLVTIPYSWQPKINWANGTCNDCTYP